MVARWIRGILYLDSEIPWDKIEKIEQEDRQEYPKSIWVMNLKRIIQRQRKS